MEFLKVYDFVQEFKEGVDRMYNEMESSGLPEPVYKEKDSMICVHKRFPSNNL